MGWAALAIAVLVAACTQITPVPGCKTTLDCLRTEYCDRGVCVVGTDPQEQEGAASSSEAVDASQPSAATPRAKQDDGSQLDVDAAVKPEMNAGMTTPEAGPPVAGAAGSMSMTPDASTPQAGAAGSMACTCSTRDPCCDGCRPQNDDGRCEPDPDVTGCVNDVCRNGACRHEPWVNFCMVDGLCVSHGVKNPNNQCEYCNSKLDTTRWTVREEGVGCDNDGEFCNGIGVCGGGSDSGRCLSFVNPCDYQFSNLRCPVCDEDLNKCSEGAECN